MTHYYRITYRGDKNSYSEDIEDADQDYEEYLREFVEKCRKQGALPASEAIGFIETLQQGDNCPPVFQRSGSINTVYVELRTVSHTM